MAETRTPSETRPPLGMGAPTPAMRIESFALPEVRKNATWRLLRLIARFRLRHMLVGWPFAAMAVCLGDVGLPAAEEWCLLALALASARGFVIAFSRVADVHESAGRHGHQVATLEHWTNWALTFGTGSLFLLACAFLSRIALVLAPIVLACLLACRYVGAQGWYGHFARGLSLGIPAMAAWASLRTLLTWGQDWPALAVGVGVTLWAAGLDMLFSCDTVDADRSAHRCTAAAAWGRERTLVVARVCHGGASLAFLLLIPHAVLGQIYFAGWAAFTLMLVYEHVLWATKEQRWLDIQGFSINAFATISLVAPAVVDIFIG